MIRLLVRFVGLYLTLIVATVGVGILGFILPRATPAQSQSVPTIARTITPAATEVVIADPPSITGDAEAGRALFSAFQPRAGTSCITCHRTDTDDRLVGPGLLHVGSRAGERLADSSAAEYIRTSIVDPDAYIVEGYPNIMPKNWEQVFTEEQINNLVAYLMSLDSSTMNAAYAP